MKWTQECVKRNELREQYKRERYELNTNYASELLMKDRMDNLSKQSESAWMYEAFLRVRRERAKRRFKLLWQQCAKFARSKRNLYLR